MVLCVFTCAGTQHLRLVAVGSRAYCCTLVASVLAVGTECDIGERCAGSLTAVARSVVAASP
jgi:hypothetical protein